MAKLNMKPVVGETREVFTGTPGQRKKKKILPRITLMGRDLPDMEDWDVGKKYLVVAELEMIGIRKGSEYEFDSDSDDNKTRGTFKIHQIGTAEEDNFQETYGRVRSAAASKR